MPIIFQGKVLTYNTILNFNCSRKFRTQDTVETDSKLKINKMQFAMLSIFVLLMFWSGFVVRCFLGSQKFQNIVVWRQSDFNYLYGNRKWILLT